MVDEIYPNELQLNKTYTSDTEAVFLYWNLSITNNVITTKIYDTLDDFDIVNFPFLDADVPRATSYGVHISQLIRVCESILSSYDKFISHLVSQVSQAI